METATTERRLDSWKAIARYLGRSCRTAQRWQGDYGLPVRHVGGATGSVFAYTHELDSWLRNRCPLTREHKSADAPVSVSTDLAGDYQVREPDQDLNCGCAPVPEEAKERSEAVVALAKRMWRVLSYGNLNSVIQTFRRAIDHDCTNAEAFAGLSSAMTVKSLVGGPDLQHALTSAKAAVHRALDLNPALPEAICVRAWLKILDERDWDGVPQALESARHERSLTSSVQIGMGFLRVAEGNLEEASTLFRQASLQSALNSVWAELSCWGLYLMGDNQGASKLIEHGRSTGGSGPLMDSVEALVMLQTGQPISTMEKLRHGKADHQSAVVMGALGYAYAEADQLQNAEELLRQLTSPKLSEQDHYAIALVLLGLRRNSEALERLDLAFRSGSLWSLGFRSDPSLRDLWSCDDFCDFLCRANYPTPIDRADPREDKCKTIAECPEIGGRFASAVRKDVRPEDALSPQPIKIAV